jgi:hypothetical protein
MTETRTTTKELKVNITDTSYRFIPAREIIKIGPETNGMIRIWWSIYDSRHLRSAGPRFFVSDRQSGGGR